MPRRVETLPVRDFTGGINYMADAFQLGDNEVSDCLNVDFDPNGGFRGRDTIRAINTVAMSATPRNLWAFCTDDSATTQLVAQVGNTIAYSTLGNFTAVSTGVAPFNVATTGVMHAATANNLLYIQRNTEQVPVKWTGAAATALTDAHGAYNDDLAAPAGGKMPKAKYICHHLNYLFHANTLETATAQRSRVRFSFPFSDGTGKGAEDYRTNDWFPVSPGDGDEITGMVSFGKELVIFKNKSTWVLRGYGPDSFQLENVSRTVGAIGQRAIAVGDEGVYFFSWPNGLQLYDGSGLKDLWYPLSPITAPNGEGSLIDGITSNTSTTSNITVGYANQRCWVSMTKTGDTNNLHTFVYDPRLGKSGGWTRYDAALGRIAEFHPPGGNRQWYAISSNTTGYVVKLHEDPSLGDLYDNGSSVGITSWCFTKWFDLGNAALVKRWKHPIFVLDGAASLVLHADVYRDYDFSGSVRSFNLTVTNNDASTLWGASTWGGGTWSSANVAATQSIEKGGLLGRGTAIACKITGPTDGITPWAVNAITFKYIPKRIRS